MGKKKQLQGAVVEIDMPVDVPPPPQPESKKKREISDVQRANLAKGMAALKAKREAKSKVVEAPEPDVQEKEVPKPIAPPVVVAPPPAPVQEVKPRKPRVVKNYLTTDDFNSFRNELFTSLKKPEPQMSVPHVPVRETPPVTIVQPIKERVITGRELLDKIFNF
jgi:hypothetical protein